MKKILIITFISLFGSISLFSQSIEFKINELISAYANNEQFNGCILVKKGDNIIYQNAFGLANREWDVNNTIDSRFLIGSISKPITALATLILVEDGYIELNKTINDYIPEYEGAGKDIVTIHQLLTHTSGIPNWFDNFSKKRVRWIFNSDEYLELTKELNLNFKPGTKFQYSNVAYNILAIICEKVAKKDFSSLINEQIFIPLNMVNTSLDKNLDIDINRANGYEYHLLEGYLHPSYVEMCNVKGCGGLLTTVEDLGKLSDECFNKQKLISKELYREMFTSYLKGMQYYGYGWWITDRNINGDTLQLISHGGSIDGYKTYFTRIIEDSTDIILLQNNYFRTSIGRKFNDNLTDEIIDVLYGKGYKLPKKSVARELGILIGKEGIEVAIESFSVLKENEDYTTHDYELNQLGKELLKNYGLHKESLKITEMALNEYPKSFILNFSYAQLLEGDDYDKSISYYQKCVDLYKFPFNKRYKINYEFALKKINDKI